MGRCQWHKKKALQKCKTQLVKKEFDKLVDGGACSPATATPTSFC